MQMLIFSTLHIRCACFIQACISCYQCNMRQWGVTNTCESPRLMPDCIGCMKTLTKVKLRDSGFIDGKPRVSTVVSRYCMRTGANNVKPTGCYKQHNNGGYTERCFCYTDLCNSGHRISELTHFSGKMFCVAVVLVALKWVVL